jgi:hypothetical protein
VFNFLQPMLGFVHARFGREAGVAAPQFRQMTSSTILVICLAAAFGSKLHFPCCLTLRLVHKDQAPHIINTALLEEPQWPDIRSLAHVLGCRDGGLHTVRSLISLQNLLATEQSRPHDTESPPGYHRLHNVLPLLYDVASAPI